MGRKAEWLPLGLCLAVMLSAVKKKKNKNKSNNNNTNEPDKE